MTTTMTTARDTDRWAEQVLEEHRELRARVARLREFLGRARPPAGEKGAHSWAREISSQLASLHDALFIHFRLEDESGMVEDISTEHPRAANKISEIVSEHPDLLREARELVSATLLYSEGQAPQDAALRRRVGTLLDRLEKHEQEETSLIQRLEYRDTGALD